MADAYLERVERLDPTLNAFASGPTTRCGKWPAGPPTPGLDPGRRAGPFHGVLIRSGT